MELEEAFKVASRATRAVSLAVPEPFGTILEVATAAFDAAIGFVKSGQDPVVQVRRMLSPDPLVASVHDEWEARLRNRSTTRAADSTPASSDSSDPHVDAAVKIGRSE